MFVGVAQFELHIEDAQSLKEKRTVVRSLRDRIRRKFEVSVAEVAHNDLHQRARFGLAIVSNNRKNVLAMLDSISEFVENEAEAQLAGWTQEVMAFDSEGQLDVPHFAFTEQDFKRHEEDS